jgi:hypothetical protein
MLNKKPKVKKRSPKINLLKRLLRRKLKLKP